MTRGIVFKKELVDKYKFDVSKVKKYTDIEPFLQMVKDNEPDIYPLQSTNGIAGGNSEYAEIGIQGFGVKNGDPNFKVVSLVRTPEFKSNMLKIREWYQKGYARKDVATVSDLIPDLKAGKVACGVNTNVKPGVDSEMQAKYGYEFVSVPVEKPVLKKTSVLGTLNAISRTTKNPEKAMELLNLMNTDKELFNLIGFGIEGKHYTKTGENRVEPVKNSKYVTANWMFGNVFNSYLLPGQADNVWEETIKINNTAEKEPLFGFTMNLEPIKTYMAQINAVHKELGGPIGYGIVDPNVEFPKFLDKLARSGEEELIAEAQKQIDEWKRTELK
jgi:putative aldouronate transport system substrate-binding protein